MDQNVAAVNTRQEGDMTFCIVEDHVFSIPDGYTHIGIGNALHTALPQTYISEGSFAFLLVFAAGLEGRRQFTLDEEDDLLQYAIQQSLVDCGTEKEEVRSRMFCAAST